MAMEAQVLHIGDWLRLGLDVGMKGRFLTFAIAASISASAFAQPPQGRGAAGAPQGRGAPAPNPNLGKPPSDAPGKADISGADNLLKGM